MKQKLQESLDRMKLLMEYSFKTNAVEENPVKFSEIGDKYKPKGNSDYPTFEEYKDAVILEDDPEDQTQQQAPVDNSQQQPVTPDPNAQTQQSVNQPPVAPQQDVQQPQADPNQQSVQVAAPAVDQTQQVQEPQPQSFVPSSTYDADLDNKLNDQINKTNELLIKFDEIQNSLSNMNVIQHQLNTISAEVESIKNPSLEDNVENVIKQSYPFNVKMSDYFKDDEEQDEPEIFKASPDEIDNYNKEDIKNSFNI